MKILVLNPFAGVAQELERCLTVARADTEIVFEDISDVYPLNYVTYIYYTPSLRGRGRPARAGGREARLRRGLHLVLLRPGARRGARARRHPGHGCVRGRLALRAR